MRSSGACVLPPCAHQGANKAVSPLTHLAAGAACACPRRRSQPEDATPPAPHTQSTNPSPNTAQTRHYRSRPTRPLYLHPAPVPPPTRGRPPQAPAISQRTPTPPTRHYSNSIIPATYIPRAPPLRLPAPISSLPGPVRPSESPSRRPEAAAGKLRSQGTRSSGPARLGLSRGTPCLLPALSLDLGIKEPCPAGGAVREGWKGVDEGSLACGVVVPRS